jgi:hypothetical protein
MFRRHRRTLGQFSGLPPGTVQPVGRRHAVRLSDEALGSLTTERLLAYRKSLLSLEDSARTSDLDDAEVAALDPTFVYFKDDPARQDLYSAVKRALANREHVD